MYKDNPLYTPTEIGGVVLYAPTDPAKYHASRYVAASWQAVYSTLGATRDFMQLWCDRMIELAEDGAKKTIRTDIGVMVNNLKYRLQYPVDEDCSIRMGAIYHMLDGEPEEQDADWYVKKMKLAKDNPDVYAFFLQQGLKYTPGWNEYLDLISSPNYFQERAEMLQSLTPLDRLARKEVNTMTALSKQPTDTPKGTP